MVNPKHVGRTTCDFAASVPIETESLFIVTQLEVVDSFA
jgi:hypothetical protein